MAADSTSVFEEFSEGLPALRDRALHLALLALHERVVVVGRVGIVQVDRVVARHREGDLELLGQVGAAVERLDRVAGDDAVAVVVGVVVVGVVVAVAVVVAASA